MSKIIIGIPRNSGWTIEQQGTDIQLEYYDPTIKDKIYDFIEDCKFYNWQGRCRWIYRGIKRKIWEIKYARTNRP